MDADYESMDLMYRASVIAVKENPVLYKGRQNYSFRVLPPVSNATSAIRGCTAAS